MNRKFHLLKIYKTYVNTDRLSLVPEGMLTAEEIDNLCNKNLAIEETKEYDVCEFTYYFKIKKFCEIETTSQETNLVQKEFEAETGEQPWQIVCKEELQSLIS